MDWSKWVGPATVIYIVSSFVAALTWGVDVNRRVITLENDNASRKDASERLVRVETELRLMTRSVKDATETIKKQE